MAKFCTNCGKKLKEGEVCNCVKKTEETLPTKIDFNKYLNKAIEVISKMFTAPVDYIKKYTKEDNFVMSIILVIVSGIAVGLFTLALIKNIYTNVMDSMGLGAGFGSLVRMSNVEIPYFKCFLITTLLGIGMHFLEALVLWIVCEKGLKVKIDYKKALNVVAPISIYMTLASFFAILGIYLATWIAVTLFVIAGILKMTALTLSLKETVCLDQNKIGYVMSLILIIPTIVIFLISSWF